MATPLIVSEVRKSFTMHLRGALQLPVVSNVSFALNAGECAVLAGPSGIGKSSILKMLYGNYSVDEGQILIQHQGRIVDLASQSPRQVLDIRRHTLGYVSQFLKTLPRVSALNIVAEPLMARGIDQATAQARAGELLTLLNLPRALFDLPPATFSGGEQQRVNIARGFITDHPILLLDEPTASLDRQNRTIVVEMIRAKAQSGTCILGIFHDEEVRDAIGARMIDVSQFSQSHIKEYAS